MICSVFHQMRSFEYNKQTMIWWYINHYQIILKSILKIYKILVNIQQCLHLSVVHNPRNGPYSSSDNIPDIYQYTTWSVFNILFCCCIIGVCALYMSCETKRKKNYRDFIGAQNTSKIAAILNTVATLSGIITLTLVTLQAAGYLTT